MSEGKARTRIAAGWADAELARLDAQGLRRRLETLQSAQGPLVRVGSETLINFSSNDYLGLANDPEVTAALVSGAAAWGAGSGASRLVVGDFSAHRALEATLAEFEDAESVLLFNAGYAANVGIVSTLVGKDDAVFSDALNHASLVDGCRLSRARTVVYPHGDVEALERALKVTSAVRKLVVTDGVFSMDGDVTPLAELVEVCETYGAALLVDEAHGTGVLGAHGRGACEAAGVEARVDVRMGTLGKAFGVFGAYAAAEKSITEWLLNRARSFVFSTALPQAVCVAARVAVERVRDDPSLRERLWANIRFFARGLGALGIPAQARSAIFPVVLGRPEQALGAAAFLRHRGLLVKAIRPPTVPVGTSRLRFALSAAHDEEQLTRALEALREARDSGLLHSL